MPLGNPAISPSLRNLPPVPVFHKEETKKEIPEKPREEEENDHEDQQERGSDEEKRKEEEEAEAAIGPVLPTSTLSGTQTPAHDSCFVLGVVNALENQKQRHKKRKKEGHDEEHDEGSKKKKKRRKKKQFDEEKEVDGIAAYSNWVPPTGQTGDGRTYLNDKFGY